jgi:hypothetical protein
VTTSPSPHSSYADGWRDAIDAARLCGAYNAAHPPAEYALCVNRHGHSGKHDDMQTPPWGDPHAAGEDNRSDAAAHREVVRSLHTDYPIDIHLARRAVEWLSDRDEVPSTRGHAIDLLHRALDQLAEQYETEGKL